MLIRKLMTNELLFYFSLLLVTGFLGNLFNVHL